MNKFRQKNYDESDQRYSYRSRLLDDLRANDFGVKIGRVTVRLAEDFGFCWGVDRAVAMVWDAINQFPDRQIWLLNQIIHNPKVNEDFRRSGVRFIFGKYAENGGFASVQSEDLVVIPAFSAEIDHLRRLRSIGCEIVDTTCPWVEKPHRRVKKYLEQQITTIIHGIRNHDETRATCSLVESHNGHFLVVRDINQAELFFSFLLGNASVDEFWSVFRDSVSRNFHPVEHTKKIGIINQTTMLASESRAIAQRLGETLQQRDGNGENFRDFDTICPATQDNQDAVKALSENHPLDIFLVVGGYDSSNTTNLLRAARANQGSFHVQAPDAIDGSSIRHRDPGSGREMITENWLPPGEVVVGLSAGASTPDTEIEQTIARVFAAAGETVPTPA